MRLKSQKSKRLKLIVFAALFLLTFSLIATGLLTTKDSGIEPEWLGNPLREDGQMEHSLNVWDLQEFGGKIYLAGGSTVTNSGPINVWAYNPQTNEFDKEYTVKEEAIEHFRVLDDELYIPAADPVKGDVTKIYRREEEKWQRYGSKAVKLAHVRDTIKTDENDILMVGNSRQLQKVSARGTAIAIPKAEGLKIKTAGVENAPVEDGITLADYNWFFSVFRYRGRIYATNSLLRDVQNLQGAIAQYDPNLKSFALNFELYNDEFIPASIIGSKDMQGIEVIYRPWNPVEFQDYLVYPVRSYSTLPQNYEEAYMNTIGFFYKSDMGNSPETLKLPQGIGEDVLVIDDELYVLASKRNSNDKFTTFVYKTNSLGKSVKWKRVLKFSDWNKARSFEYLDGTFYFGLGQNYDEGIHNSGDILSYSPKSKQK